MTSSQTPFTIGYDAVAQWFFRFAAAGLLPARWFSQPPPPVELRVARRGRLDIEIVSHCWNYSHLLAYQLSSLVKFPPRLATVTVTIFYAQEDVRTAALLAFFGNIAVPGVTWNWQALPTQQLFRRAIGRNKAARASRADWVWFTDCDLLFRENCLDSLSEALQGRRDALVYPRQERVTPLLPQDSQVLTAGGMEPGLYDIDPQQFTLREPSRATGPLQIVHGDVARACGYCDSIGVFQKPAGHWRKAHEDRVFRWLLGTLGTPIEVAGVYRIRHAQKGRYRKHSMMGHVRTAIRRLQSRLCDRQPG